jgi:hypothetical protein
MIVSPRLVVVAAARVGVVEDLERLMLVDPDVELARCRRSVMGVDCGRDAVGSPQGDPWGDPQLAVRSF